ncbi:hypothetical protein B0H16DRAFT_1737434 [Mycena metata]|uniref:Uncharacterized protein n=1 Tax=Mycena metata TaxID=1033252 RepID=A0AAD7MM54_9AGAR|nr:hypothetical protein B0H16DRAFT_1737434 [Mycena metata]
MPASHPKDRVTGISIREVPSNLSKEVFKTNIRAVADSLMSLPVCKKNILRYDLIFQTPVLAAEMRTLGLPESRSHIASIAECESVAHFAEVFGHADARTFFVDVVTKLELQAAVDSDQFRDKLEGLADRLLALPVWEKAIVTYSMLLPQRMDTSFQSTDAILRALGLPAPEPVAVLIAEAKSPDHYAEFPTEFMRELELHANASLF